MMSVMRGLGVVALLLVVQPCTANECDSVLCSEEAQRALLEDAAFDEGIQLVQARAKKLKPTARTEPTEVPFIDQSEFKPSMDDWKKVQTGLFLLRGHAEGSTDHKTATSTEELQSMLVTLKGLVNDCNQSTTGLEAKEHESEEWFLDQKTKHAQKLLEIEDRDKKHILSHDFYVNGTRTENMMFDYWGGVRDRMHKKYLSIHKVKDGMMERVKTMVDAYEAVLAARATDSSSASLPDHYKPDAIIDFCDAALAHVSDALLSHGSEM